MFKDYTLYNLGESYSYNNQNRSNWQDKHNGKIPSSINRHWLVHSMYDYDDIKRADCIKLFCILFQMVELYSLEEKRHLRKKYMKKVVLNLFLNFMIQ